jgi:hypothetical protein
VGSLLTNSDLVLEPNFDWRCGRGSNKRRFHQAGEVS